MASAGEPVPDGERAAVQLGPTILARNTLLNVVGQVVPLLVNIATVPYVIRHLGNDQFGMLSLAWLVVGYFALFDLGIGPATTKFVAERLGRGEHSEVPRLVWTALVSQSALGVAAAAVLLAVTPTLVTRVLTIPPGMQADAYWVFATLAVSLPISFATGSVGGVLSASQRFDLLNSINIPASCLTYLLPACALSLGYGLRTSVVLIVLARVATFLVTLGCCIRLHPALRSRIQFDWKIVRTLLGFGGWVAVSGAVGPILMYFDRFLFGALISVAAVGFFTPPSMIASKLGILHGGLLLTLFPAFCMAHGRGDDGWIRDAFVRSLKLLVLVVGAACVLLIFFARPILELWVGAEFARKGTVVLQVLCIGVFFNALTHVPVALLQGVGRADLTAKLQMVQVPLHVALVSVLTWRFGLEGGALAWTLRMVFECALFIGAGVRVNRLSLRTLFGPQLQRSIAIVALLAAGLVIASALTDTLLGHIILAATVTTFFTFATWLYVFDNAERSQVRALLRVGS